MKSNFTYRAIKIEKESSRHGKDFSFKVEDHELGLFSSKKAAEAAILQCVKDYANDDGWTYGLAAFYVKKIKLDKALEMKSTWEMPISEEEWSYTKDGKLFTYTPFASNWEKGKYLGTPPDAIKFKVGDYAWTYMCGRFVPAKVLATPFTPEEWKKKFGFASDASDDCYLVMYPHGHDHPQTVDLFPIDEKLPLKVIRQIEAAEKEYLS